MNNSKVEYGYIYVIKEREFLKTKENIYKIGKTKQDNFNRFKQYPKNSMLLYYRLTKCCDIIEKRIINKLSEKFEQQKNIGTEYFKGNITNILIEIIKIILPFSKDYINQSNDCLDLYYNKINSKFKTDDEISIEVLKKLEDDKSTIEDINNIICENDRNLTILYKPIKDIVKYSIIEKYIMSQKIFESKQFKEFSEKKKCYIFGMYNSLKYMIECVIYDPQRGDFSNDENDKLMKLAGNFFLKYDGNTNLMHYYLNNEIPIIFHRQIDYLWDGIGDWKA
jgi:hypothetical protein